MWPPDSPLHSDIDLLVLFGGALAGALFAGAIDLVNHLIVSALGAQVSGTGVTANFKLREP